MATPKITKGVREYMREIGRKGGLKGGKARTTAKIEAVRQNGLKGGRPRKSDTSDSLDNENGQSAGNYSLIVPYGRIVNS